MPRSGYAVRAAAPLWRSGASAAHNIGGYGQIYGSLFGKNLNAAGFVSVGYDESIQEPSRECPPSEGDIPRVR